MVGWRGKDRHQPDLLDAQVSSRLWIAVIQIIQLAYDPVKIALSIAIAIEK